MKISVEEVSKRFIRHTIFKNVSVDFEAGQSYALLGANGSGKSTLLRIIAGMQSPSKGTLRYNKEDRAIAPETIYEHISFCAPGMELVEELTLTEMLEFHFRFKPILPQLTIKHIIELIGLQDSSNNFIANFSSGMKQRVKLAQAILLILPCYYWMNHAPI